MFSIGGSVFCKRGEREREREIETYRQTDRDIHTYIHADGHCPSHTEIHIMIKCYPVNPNSKSKGEGVGERGEIGME